ncbi:1-phosphofructokinase [Macrococcus hajekii]|uniref:Tagatose-6-phosphate kinase n=1 Tax=Macrococcus hajekii TaxID=198482 RepID=A0A4V3BDW1_9STAP|nr:1-phosphofructokinase [Macrococcus hajekii]TDM01524.1 1-phosphofructokinase [Macrococcus hajekii]GGB00714.1 tagatose-6-phosphate kinase [Macrococcus hajekii]
MIYTLTLNPSVDYVVFADDIKLGELNRSQKTFKFAGGKGINVSRVLQAHGIPSTALGFIGGFPGALIQQKLEESEIATDFVAIQDDTRINIKLKGGNETEINAPGPVISQAETAQLFKQIEQLTAEDTLVIAGSIPSSMQADIYEDIARLCKCQFVVDAEKDLLLSVLKYHPVFIKPNKTELEEMFDCQLHTDDDIKAAARELIQQGAQNVMVSLGGEGALFVSESLVYKAQVPSGRVVNTVGSGDSTVAGMLAGRERGLSLSDSFKLAVASGTATAFTEDLATDEQIQQILPNVQLTII